MKKLIVVLFSLLALPAGAQITMQGGVTLIGGGGGGACTNCALTTAANAFTQTNIFPALTVTNGVNGLPLYENQGLFNIGLGVDSTPSTATGPQNLGIGDGTLASLTSGYDNASLGVAANGSVTTGFENTAFGTFALQNNVTGGGNDAQGSLALADALGNNNTAQGEESLSTLVTGNNNAAVGAFSGCGTLCSSGSGPINTLNNGIYFGYQTGASANNLTNQLLIGYNIQSSLSNYMQLGNSAITAATIYGAPTFPSLQSAGTQCAELTATGLLAGTGSACGSGGGTYPGAGVANSTGSAWGTSYQVGTAANDLVQLNGSAALPAVSGANLTALTAANISSGTAGISVTGNAATATVASGLTGSPAITVSNVTDSALTSGDCVQATTGGLLVTTANPCGTGSGSGITTQTNSTNNASQSVLNFTTTSTIAFSNPSGGLEEATIVSPGANTVLGFNGSNAYAGFTAGTGISLASGLITNTGITGTLGTANCIVKEATSSTVTCAAATDNGTIFSITDSGGLQVVSSLPGLSSLGAGTGTFSSPCTNCYGEVGPLTGGTAFWFQHANTAAAGFELWAAPASLYGLNVTQSTFVHLPFHMDSVTSAAGLYPSGYQIAIAYPGTAGHFTSLQGAYQGGGCSTPPTINVADITQSTTGTALTLNATTGTPAKNSQTLTWNAGDLVVIEVTGVGAGCTGAFHAVSADGLIP